MQHTTFVGLLLYMINPFSARLAKPGPFIILFCLPPDDLTHQGLTHQGLTHQSPRLAKTSPFIILFCLTPEEEPLGGKGLISTLNHDTVHIVQYIQCTIEVMSPRFACTIKNFIQN